MGFVTPFVAPRWILAIGQVFMIGGALLVAFAPTPDKYWPMVVPALILTALGVASGSLRLSTFMRPSPRHILLTYPALPASA